MRSHLSVQFSVFTKFIRSLTWIWTVVFPGIQVFGEKEPGFIGIGYIVSDELPPDERYSSKFGVKITLVMTGSPADNSGLRAGDVIMGINNREFSLPKEKVVDTFRARLKHYYPGDTIVIKVVREEIVMELYKGKEKVELPAEKFYNLKEFMQGKEIGETYTVKSVRVRDVFDKRIVLASRPSLGTHRLPPNKEIHPELESVPPSEIELVAEKCVEHYGLKADYQDLRRRLAGCEQMGDNFRRNEIVYVHRNPFRMREVANKIFANLVAERRDYLGKSKLVLKETRRLLDVKADSIPTYKSLSTGIYLEEHLSQLEEILKLASRERDEAFASFSNEEKQFLMNNFERLTERFEEHVYIYNDENEKRLKTNTKLIDLASKLKYASLFNATEILLSVLDPAYLSGLKRDIENAGIDLSKEYIAEKETPFGKIIISGTGSNWYSSESELITQKDAAIIIDLGGNDFYANNTGSSTKSIPCAILIDMEGNDAYEGTRNFVQGTGLFGIGIILDISGNDSYIGIRECQGAGFMGIGLLIDVEGNDTYRSHGYAQGCGLWGAGILLENGGDDRYESHIYAQGVGIAGGVGIITDALGNDSYYSKGTHPTSYGTWGVYDGWSQGCGVGFRELVSGGIGVLQDCNGVDRFEGGNFSQGGGYYFGWGLLESRGNESDTYIGSRYAQGFSAHYALGTFFEEGGNDTYQTRQAVVSGLAWDVSVSWFEDKAGDDSYEVKGFSVGASAHNSITIFIDRDGVDKYIGEEPAIASPNDYHGGISLSLFVDEGGDKDFYSKNENNIITCRHEYGCFLDLPGSIKDMLVEKSFNRLALPMKKKKY